LFSLFKYQLGAEQVKLGQLDRVLVVEFAFLADYDFVEQFGQLGLAIFQ